MNARVHRANPTQMRALCCARPDFIPTLAEVRALDAGERITDPSGRPLAIVQAGRAASLTNVWTYREEWN